MRTLAEIIAAIKREEPDSENDPDTDVLQDEEPVAENFIFPAVPIKEEQIDDEVLPPTSYEPFDDDDYLENERDREAHETKRSRDEERTTTTNKRSRQHETEEAFGKEDLTVYEKLQLDYQDLERKLETSERQKREHQEQLEATEKEKHEFLTQVEKLQSGYQVLQENLDTSERKNRELQQQLEATKTEKLEFWDKVEKLLETSERENFELQQQLEATENEKVEFLTKVQQLLETSARENDKLKEQLEATEKEKQDTEDKLLAENQRLSDQVKMITEGSKNMKATKKAKETLKARETEIKLLRNENGELRKVIEKGKKKPEHELETEEIESQTLKDSLKAAELELLVAKGKAKAHEKLIREQKDDLDERAALIQGYLKNIADYQTEKHDTKKQLLAMEAEKKKITEARAAEVQLLRNQNGELRKAMEREKKSVEDFQKAKEVDQQQALEAMEKEKTSLEDQLKGKTNEMQQLRSKIEELRKLMQTANDAKQSLEAKGLKWSSRCLELQSEMKRAKKAQLKKTENETQRLQSENEELRKAKQLAEEKINAKEAENRSIEGQLNAQLIETQQLRAANEKLRKATEKANQDAEDQGSFIEGFRKGSAKLVKDLEDKIELQESIITDFRLEVIELKNMKQTLEKKNMDESRMVIVNDCKQLRTENEKLRETLENAKQRAVGEIRKAMEQATADIKNKLETSELEKRDLQTNVGVLERAKENLLRRLGVEQAYAKRLEDKLRLSKSQAQKFLSDLFSEY